VPSFESFAIVPEMVPGAQTEEAGGEPLVEFEWNSVAQEPVADANVSFADLNETDDQGVGELQANFSSAPTSAGPSSQPFNLAEGSHQATAGLSSTQDELNPSRVESMMQQELESVDFYITQGYSDIAVDTLDLLEQQFGPHSKINARRAKLRALTEGAGGVEHFASNSELVEGGSSSVTEIDSEVDVAFAEIEQTPVVIAPEKPSAVVTSSGIDSGLAEIFEEFRVEAEGEHAASTEDYETHFNMATAYKEMDLLDDAIREFQTAAGLTVPADGTARYFHCCNMLGHCFVQKSLPQAAVLWFKKGLEAPGRSGEEYKALQYELASAYEQLGDVARAIEVFTEVYGLDVGYRDVAGKLQDLQARKAAQKKKKKWK
jgi:tetratricopeptide (TPR) repeat protein